MHDQLTLTAEATNQIVPVLRVLADRTRLRIVGLLRGRELNVTSLCEVLDLAQPTVSHHLGLLREVGLVQNRREGKQVFYALNPAAVELISEHGELAMFVGPLVLQLQDRKRWEARRSRSDTGDSPTAATANPQRSSNNSTTSATPSVAAADMLSS